MKFLMKVNMEDYQIGANDRKALVERGLEVNRRGTAVTGLSEDFDFITEKRHLWSIYPVYAEVDEQLKKGNFIYL